MEKAKEGSERRNEQKKQRKGVDAPENRSNHKGLVFVGFPLCNELAIHIAELALYNPVTKNMESSMEHNIPWQVVWQLTRRGLKHISINNKLPQNHNFQQERLLHVKIPAWPKGKNRHAGAAVRCPARTAKRAQWCHGQGVTPSCTQHETPLRTGPGLIRCRYHTSR